MQILEILANAPDAESLQDCLPEIRALIRKKQAELHSGCVPPEKLIVRQTVSKNLTEYRAPVPAFSALQELARAGKSLRLGQTVRLIYTRGFPRAHAWDAPIKLDPRRVNLQRYRRLLDRAAATVLEPFMDVSIQAWLARVRQLEF
jgi:DNA polymerase elongation subunit (family B)